MKMTQRPEKSNDCACQNIRGETNMKSTTWFCTTSPFLIHMRAYTCASNTAVNITGLHNSCGVMVWLWCDGGVDGCCGSSNFDVMSGTFKNELSGKLSQQIISVDENKN